MYLVTPNILDIKHLEVEELREILLPLLAGVIAAKLRGEIYIEYDSFESNHSLFMSINFSPSRYNFVDGFSLNYCWTPKHVLSRILARFEHIITSHENP